MIHSGYAFRLAKYCLVSEKTATAGRFNIYFLKPLHLYLQYTIEHTVCYFMEKELTV